jgi:hypothetical protein
LTDRVEAYLQAHVASTEEVARALGTSPNAIARVLRGPKGAGRVVNVGDAERPRWTWILGDEGTTPDLQAAVLRLLRAQPMTMATVIAGTGAGVNRVKGVLMRLVAAHLVRHDDGRPAVWSATRRRH